MECGCVHGQLYQKWKFKLSKSNKWRMFRFGSFLFSFGLNNFPSSALKRLGSSPLWLWKGNDDVSNQQDAIIFVYWSFYWSIWICSTCFGRQTRPSPGAILTYIRLWYNAPISLPTGDKVQIEMIRFHLNPVTGRQQYRCIVPKPYISQKCSWRWVSLSPETCRADTNRSIKENCCILLIAYIVVLKTHGLTYVKYELVF